MSSGGRLEDALAQYKRSKEFGVEKAAVHIRNVRLSAPGASARLLTASPLQVSAKILGKRMEHLGTKREGT